MITSKQAGILLERWGQSIKKWGSQGDDLRVILTAIRNDAYHIDNITSFINKGYKSTPPGTSTPSRALYDWMNKNESNNMDGISEFLKEIKERNPYLKASSSQVVNTKNLITVSSQLVYPFWYDHNPAGAFARNTVIHLFRADENSPWSIIALPENDRFAADAYAGNAKEFEQRYFKFVSGAQGIQFEEGISPEITAQNAFEALLTCYPVKNQNVPKFSKELLTEQFKSCFTQRMAPDFGDGIDPRAILPSAMLASEERARKTLKDGKISVIDEKKPIKVTNIDDNHTKVVFEKTTFNLHVVGDEIIVFADFDHEGPLNCLHGGMLRLSKNSDDWNSQISQAWLIQQVAIHLGAKYNPETKNIPEKQYEPKLKLPISQICEVAKALLEQHLERKLSKEVQLPIDATDNVVESHSSSMQPPEPSSPAPSLNVTGPASPSQIAQQPTEASSSATEPAPPSQKIQQPTEASKAKKSDSLKNTVQTKMESLLSTLQSFYKYGENGGSRIHFNTVNTNDLTPEVKKQYIKANGKPFVGDGLKRAILNNFLVDLQKCKTVDEVDTCVGKFKETPEYKILDTHQRPQTFKFTESKTSSIKALEQMCSDAKQILNPDFKQELKDANENKSSMSIKP